MGLLKKLIIIVIILALYCLGNIEEPANELLSKGGSLFVLLVGAIIIYIFFKLVFKAMGCLPSLVVILGIIIFVLYTLGALSDGVGEIVPNLQDFFGTKDRNEEMITLFEDDVIEQIPAKQETISENFNDITIEESKDFENADIENKDTENKEIIAEEVENTNNEEKIAEKTEIITEEIVEDRTEQKVILPEKKQSFFDKIMNYNSNTKNTPAPMNPYDYPAIYGPAKVISGDTLAIRNYVVHLYGIDAPSKQQSCSDARGRAYRCGKEAALWLQNWILDNEIECHILKRDNKNNMLGVCSYGQYDLGAALVMVGWAVPLPGNSIYIPYEREAQKNHNGMWQGKFYKPWDWVNIQSQKPKIKVIKHEKKKRLWDYL